MSAEAPVRPGTMRAWTFDRYGPPENLVQRDVAFPSFRDSDEVLLRVRASSVNPADRHEMHLPFFLRGGKGFLRPNAGRLGGDVAGTVEAVGANVRDLQVGDEVFGVGRGTFAEYAVADQSQLLLKPATVPWEQAGAIPIAATTALQALQRHGGVQAGERVLINGASGGVGLFAVQIARALGARVDAVCSAAHADLVRGGGAQRVYDYAREDFTQSGERYDLVVDAHLNHTTSAYRRILTRRGRMVAVGAGLGSAGRTVRRLLGFVLVARVRGPPTRFFIASIRRPELTTLAEMVG